ncbi:coiled-coil domain-containing protein 113 [Diabrotica virgifera virgifera]|uniref:Cilia- and flagella-associated protein 263 n=1 Tax=Diabrotica virgifera virgifera TaxID=50390 RepID=A0ABM5IDV4_DIAVI|nr:coiled-coil domain-containing protein 113 [Diabrotica virgifera virgifera]
MTEKDIEEVEEAVIDETSEIELLSEDTDTTSESSENAEQVEEEQEQEQQEQPVQQPKDPLDELTYQQLVDLVNNMEDENRHLQLENAVFMDFLKNYSPSALDGLDTMINYALSLATKQTTLAMKSSSLMSATSRSSTVGSLGGSSRKSMIMGSLPSINNLMEGRGPKINISTRTDMIVKAIEETQQSLDHFVKKSLRLKRNIMSDLQEFKMRETDIIDTRNVFEHLVVTQGLDKLTQRIPAEKWIRFMDDWLKNAALAMEKLRLRTASLKLQYRKVSATLIQRQELGENVHAVDFDQLEIENKHLLQKIDQKQIHLLELKRMNGGANLILSKHKKYLLKQQVDYNKIQVGITEKEQQIHELDEEHDKVEEERDKAKEKYENFKVFKSTYRVPDVMDYVVLKKELDELRKNIKIWQRRKNIQDISLNASIRQMKNLTGSSTVDPDWLQDPPPEIEDQWL